MMIDAGVREVLRGKVPELFEGGHGRDAARGDVAEEGGQPFRGHATCASGAR